MKVTKWGNSLAVRLPADLVRKLGIREGDHLDLRADGSGISVARRRRPDEVLADLARFRGRLPAASRLGRDDAHER
jgi:antitoxin MazE